MTLITMGFEQFVHWRYGVVAAFGFTLLTIGVKTENATCAGIGGLLLMAPAVNTGT